MKKRDFIILSVLATAFLWKCTLQSALPEPSPTLQSNTSDPVNASRTQPGHAGSNVAGHNEACKPNGDTGPEKFCNKAQQLICDNGVCKCDLNTVDPDAPLFYSSSAISCLPIATAKTSWACSDDSQCVNSKYGKYSRCNTTLGIIGVDGRCECFDTELKHREVFFVQNSCYLKKILDQTCMNDMECNATISGEAICLGAEIGENKAGVCKCADQHQFESNYKECLKLGTRNSVCKSDFQCQHEDALGPLSKCHSTSKTCDCWDPVRNTKFHEGRCHISRGQNETCTTKLECVLGYHRDADCLEHDSYNGEKVCQCSPGATCRSAAVAFTGSTALTFVGLITSTYYCYKICSP
jgi:hypothetical protein